MMDEEKKIEELKEKLNKMISKNMDFKEILKVSQELDIYIVDVMKSKIQKKT